MHIAPMITNKMTGEEMAALQAVAEDKKKYGKKEYKGEREREKRKSSKKKIQWKYQFLLLQY